MIARTNYMEQLKQLRSKRVIKVITGVRRCGKSTLLEMFQEHLKKEGVPAKNILAINLEDGEFMDMRDGKSLYRFVNKRLAPRGMNYVFIDEVQQVEGFEKAVNSLFIKKNVDIYITGSNAHLLSGELATLLSGRYIEISMLPFSFVEFQKALGKSLSLQDVYNEYIQCGGFPYLATEGASSSEKVQRDYLGGIYNTVLLKDVVERTGVKSVETLERVVRFLFDNIGSLISIRKICNALTSAGHKTTAPTVEVYVQALCDAFIFYCSQRYDIKGKDYLRSGVKYYAVDLGLRNFLLGQKMGDVGHILENVVFLELQRRGHAVFVGKIGTREVDFVTVDRNQICYYQVVASVRDPQTLARELAAFESIPDHYTKILLTLDNDPPAIHNGIRQQNALEFLIG